MIIGHCETREGGRFRSVPWFHGFRFLPVYGFYQTGANGLYRKRNYSCNSKALSCVSGPLVVAVAEHAHLFRGILVPDSQEFKTQRRSGSRERGKIKEIVNQILTFQPLMPAIGSVSKSPQQRFVHS